MSSLPHAAIPESWVRRDGAGEKGREVREQDEP